MSRKLPSRPLRPLLKEIEQEMEFYKKKLILACKIKNQDEANKYLEKLFSLRSKQTATRLKISGVNEQNAKKEIQSYFADCGKLTAAVFSVFQKT